TEVVFMVMKGFALSRCRRRWTRATGCLVASLGVILSNRSEAGISSVQQRIDAVQNHLLPPVLIDGELVRSQTLTDRMAALHVPGVSVAVIHGGMIDWARGFGVARPDG